MTIRHDTLSIRWLGYATARLSGSETTVYADPGRYGVLTGEWSVPDGVDTRHPAGPAYDARDGDVVLVTHDHHYDPDGLRRVAAQDATLVDPSGVYWRSPANTGGEIQRFEAGAPFAKFRVVED